MALKRHRQVLHTISEINITNLLDTAFILLIAFMLVAPSMKSGIPIDLPEVATAESIDNQKEEDSYTVSIKAKDAESPGDRIFMNGERVMLEELAPRMAKAHEANPKVSVTIESDKEAKADTMVQVIHVVNSAQIENFIIATQPGAVQPAGKPKKNRDEKSGD